MSAEIRIDFAMAEGALLRLLGQIERRGFEVRGIALQAAEGEGHLALDVAPRDPGRRLEVIAAQLRRLHDVRHVQFSSQDPR